jgi:hypothetical protein
MSAKQPFDRVVWCSICSSPFDPDAEGVEGDIGIIPVAFCPTCKAGIYDFAMQTWDLIRTEDVPHYYINHD